MPGSQKDDVKVFMHSNQRGSAEIIRFFCREAGIVFHEVDIDAATFEAMKSDNSIMFGELPAIQIGDDDAHFIEGPTACLAALAKMADDIGLGQAGNSYQGLPSEGAVVMGICEAAVTFQRKMMESEDAAAVIDEYFAYFTNLINRNDNDDAKTECWSYGTQMTYADVAIGSTIHYAIEMKGGSGAVRRQSKVKDFHDNFVRRVRVQFHTAWRAKEDTANGKGEK